MRPRCGDRRMPALLAAALVLFAAAVSAALPAAAQVPPTYRPGDAALASPETDQGLSQAIEQYRAIVRAGGWPRLDLPARGLRPNDDDRRVALVRQRLQMSGDLAPGPLGTFYDGAVRDAVARYQVRHGLRPTGTVAGLTLAHMNVPAEERLQQLVDNQRRLRALLPKIGGGRYVLMNTPDFELQAVNGGQVEFSTRVIVGKRSTQTPDVSVSVQAVDLGPYWHVPSTIAVRDLVPTIRKEPTYLASKKIRVFSSYGGGEIDPAEVNWFAEDGSRFTFRQDPGPQNALGLIRLDMPNKHIVYMHDTPYKDLFEEDERSFSAGCVRVKNVAQLAAWLIGDGSWTPEALLAAGGSGQRSSIKLARPVPVHFVYLTAWVREGVLHFRNDLYNRDAAAVPEAMASAPARGPFQALAP